MSSEGWSALFLGVMAAVSVVWTAVVAVVLVQVLKNLRQLQESMTQLQQKALPTLDKVNDNLITLQGLMEKTKAPVDEAGRLMVTLTDVSTDVKSIPSQVRRLATPLAMQTAGVLGGALSVLKWYLGSKKQGGPNG